MLPPRVSIPVRIKYLVPGSVWLRGNVGGSGSDSADNRRIGGLWDSQLARTSPGSGSHGVPYLPTFIWGWCSSALTRRAAVCSKPPLESGPAVLAWGKAGGRLFLWSPGSRHRKGHSAVGSTSEVQSISCTYLAVHTGLHFWCEWCKAVKLLSSEFGELIPFSIFLYGKM